MSRQLRAQDAFEIVPVLGEVSWSADSLQQLGGDPNAESPIHIGYKESLDHRTFPRMARFPSNTAFLTSCRRVGAR